MPKYNQGQVPDKAILDIMGRQAYMANEFSVSLKDVANPGTTEKSIITIVNPNSELSGKSIFIKRIRVCTGAASVTGLARIYGVANTLVVGSAFPGLCTRIGQPNATAITNLVTSVASLGNLIDSAGFQTARDAIIDTLIVLDAGQRITIAVVTSGAAAIDVTVDFYEC